MKCSLDRSAIKNSLHTAVSENLNNTNLFRFRQGNYLFSDRTAAQKVVDDTNALYKTKVLNINLEEVSIDIPNDLVNKYFLSQDENIEEMIFEEMKKAYMEPFSDVSLNLTSEILWANHPMLDTPTSKKLYEFAKKINPKFKIRVTNDLNQKAVSLIADNIIVIQNRTFFDEFPEEIAHFFIELLPNNSSIRKEIVDNIVNFSIYSETYKLYSNNPLYQRNGKPNIDKIKREAAAKLIAKYIKESDVSNADNAFGKEKKKVESWFSKFMKFLRKQFYKLIGVRFSELTMDLSSPYRTAAQNILQNDISSLDIAKSINPYDSIFYSILENNMDEITEASDLAKAMKHFSTGMKRKLQRSFLKFLRDKKLEKLLEYLSDPRFPSYNRIWDSINLLKESEMDFGFFEDEENLDINLLAEATNKVALAFSTLQSIPTALNSVLLELQKDANNKKLDENELVSKLTELQHYMKFIETFNNISSQFIEMLNNVKSFEGLNNSNKVSSMVEDMIATMGTTQTQFDVANKQIISIVQKYLLNLSVKWTEELFKVRTKDITDRQELAKLESTKIKLQKKLEEQFTNVEQLKAALTGNFNEIERNSILAKSGIKFDTSKIKDVSKVDNLIFLIGGPSLMGDPFISSAIAFYVDKKYEGIMKAAAEERKFANKILPLLEKTGLGYYEAQQKIQNVQSSYVEWKEEKDFKRRALLSQMDRFNFQYQRQVLIASKEEASKSLYRENLKLKSFNFNIDNLKEEIADKKSKNEDSSVEEEKLTALEVRVTEVKESIKTKTIEYEKAKKELDDFIKTYSNRKYTDKFYESLEEYQSSKSTDSSTLKEIKKLNSLIISLQVKMTGENLNGVFNELTSLELSEAMTKRVALEQKLPEVEASSYEKFKEIYVPDKEATERAMAAHKSSWIITQVNKAINNKGNISSRDELEQKYSSAWDNIFLIETPAQEFWEERSETFSQIAAIMEADGEVPQSMIDTLKDLEKRRKKLLKGIKAPDMEVFIGNIQNVMSPISDNFLYEDLISIEEELRALRFKTGLIKRIDYAQAQTGKDPIPKANIDIFIGIIDMIYAVKFMAEKDGNISDDYIKKLFSSIYNLSQSNVDLLKEEFQKESPDLELIFKELGKNTKTDKVSKNVASTLANKVKEIGVENFEELFIYVAKATAKVKNAVETEELAALWKKISDDSQNIISLQYSQFILHPMMHDLVPRAIYSKENGESVPIDLQLFKDKFDTFLLFGQNITTTESLSEFLDEEFFDQIVRYLKFLEDTGMPYTRYSSDFISKIHTKKTKMRTGYNQTDIRPVYFLTKPTPKNDDLITAEPAYFLRRSKVNPQFITEKIKETDERVINGTVKATVDANGEWLPLEKKEVMIDGKVEPNKFWNKEYEALKNGTDGQSKALFEMLQAVTQEYLKYQENLQEGDRLDTLLPSRMVDSYEKKMLYVKNSKEILRNISEFFSLRQANSNSSDEKLNYDEELDIITKRNIDIYTGTLASEQDVKLKSKRSVLVDRVSEDILSGVMFFLEDIYEYNAKNVVNPIFKSFSDVFTDAFSKNPYSNKVRKEIFDLYRNVEILDIVPDNFANNPLIARGLKLLANTTTLKLLADPLGALINLGTGEMQNIIENTYDKKTWANYLSSGVEANVWLAAFNKDSVTFSRQNLSLQSQMVQVFGFFPQNINLSNRMSKYSLATDVRNLLMQPREQTELYMGIHLGLSVLLSQDVMFKNNNVYNGKKLKVVDLYQLSADGNIELKLEFATDDDFNKEYNPITGTKVNSLRRMFIQKYTLLQGNFYDFNQSYVSHTAIGKAAELMKRWFVAGYIRRFQGATMDQFSKEEREGHHYTMIFSLRDMIDAFKKDKMEGVMEWWKLGMNKKQKNNIAKSGSEMLYILIWGLLIAGVLGYDDDDPDKNKKLAKMSVYQQLALLVMIRMRSEMGTFIPLPFWGLGMQETFRAFLDPFSVIKGGFLNIAGIGTLMVNTIEDLLGFDVPEKNIKYQKDSGYWYKEKGDYKILALLLNTIGYTGYTFEPEQYIKTITSLQNRIK